LLDPPREDRKAIDWSRMRGSDDRAEIKNLFTKPEALLPQLEAFVDRQAYQNLRHGGSCGLRSGRASIHNSTSF
jgi:hypothetical protein